MGGMTANRCHARDADGTRCTITSEHQEIVNSKGQRAIAHETKHSMWSTPLSGLRVVGRDESGREVLEPDFSELAEATQRTTADWKEAWDALSHKETWPVLCQLALTSGGAENPVVAAHRINALAKEYDESVSKR